MRGFWPRRILGALGAALLLFGGGTFVGGTMASGCVATTERVRLPLGLPSAAAADAAGRIYVVDDFYNRVQRFSPGGRFEAGWHVAPYGPYRLRVEPDGTVEVAAAKAEAALAYDPGGRPLGRRSLRDGEFDAFAGDEPSRFRVRNALSGRPVGDGSLVVGDDWALAFLRAPVPAFAFLLAGIALLIGISRRRRGGWRVIPPPQRAGDAGG